MILSGVGQEKRNNLFGKITLGFLANVFLCYFFLGIHYSLELFPDTNLLGTTACKAPRSGMTTKYLTDHHFVLSAKILPTLLPNYDALHRSSAI